jgi:adenylate cyclase
VRDLVVARAGGNPLFVEEIVRSLAGARPAVRRGDRWECARARRRGRRAGHAVRPAAVARRRAGGDDARALQEAAVLGAEFDAALLRAIASEPRGVDAALQRLAAAICSRRRDARWRFTHALLHEVATRTCC